MFRKPFAGQSVSADVSQASSQEDLLGQHEAAPLSRQDSAPSREETKVSSWQARLDTIAFFTNGIAFCSRMQTATDGCLGLVNNFTYVVFISAAQDIIQASNDAKQGSGLILVANIVPGLLSKLILPSFMHLISYR